MVAKIGKGVSPIKVVLVVLFSVLGMGEFLDGIYDVSDFAVPLLLLLALNDIFVVSKRKEKEGSGLAVIPKGDIIDTDFKKKGVLGRNFNLPFIFKLAMNSIFIFLLLSPLLLEALHINNYFRKELYRYGVIVWSCIFLAISLYNLRQSFAFSKLIFAKFAVTVLLVTVFVF